MKTLAGCRRLVAVLPIGLTSVLVLLWSMLSLVCWAQGPAPVKSSNTPVSTASTTAPSGVHESTKADVEAFLDGIMPAQIERENIAGATVVVVKDGKVLVKKGYGLADVASKRPVSPDATLFRPGSISKLFTWTAVMQMVEQGKIDLDRDVNTYLDFKIPEAYGQPITMRNIMTHTTGFEEEIKDVFVPKASDMRPLRSYVVNRVPRRIFPPGKVPAYSNYATALAGYIVQRVSGQPYEQYIADHILIPLGMKHSTFVQPLPPELQPLMSSGYKLGSDKKMDFEFVQASPAGALSTTADDMSHFLIAHLQDGKYGDTQILRPETAQLMHSRQFSAAPNMNAMALGFYEETRNGHRIIGHAGDTTQFHSDLHLIPDANLGLFVSYNSMGKGEINQRSILFEKFMNRYFPYDQTEKLGPIADAPAHVRVVSGTYMSSRRPGNTFARFAGLSGQLSVNGNADGTISVDTLKDPNGQPKRWEEIEPFVYREVQGQRRLTFVLKGEGAPMMVYDFPVFVFQRVPWYQTKSFTLLVFVGPMIVFVLTLVFWMVAAIARKHYGCKLDLTPANRRLRRLILLVCGVNLAFYFLSLMLLLTHDSPASFTDAIDKWVRLLQLVGWLGVVGTLVAIYNFLRPWSAGTPWWWNRTHAFIVMAACLAFAWFALYWRILAFSMHF